MVTNKILSPERDIDSEKNDNPYLKEIKSAQEISPVVNAN